MRLLRQVGFGLLLLVVSLGVVLLGLLAALGDAATLEAGLESACPPPENWIRQDMREMGVSLADLATLHGTTVDQIREANCLPSTLVIPAGRPLFLPPPAAPNG